MSEVTHYSAIKNLSNGDESYSICRRPFVVNNDPSIPMCRDCAIIAMEDNQALSNLSSILVSTLEQIYDQISKMKSYLDSVEKITDMMGSKQHTYRCCDHCEHSLYPDATIEPERNNHAAPCRVTYCEHGKIDDNEGKYMVKLNEAMEDVFGKIEEMKKKR